MSLTLDPGAYAHSNQLGKEHQMESIGIKVWLCLIALCFGVAIGTSDPVLTNMSVCFIIVSCIMLYISEWI